MAATLLPFYCCEGAILDLGRPNILPPSKGHHLAFEGHHCALLSHPPPAKWRKLTAPSATRIFYWRTRPRLPQPPFRGESNSSSRSPPTIVRNMLLCFIIFSGVESTILHHTTSKQLQLSIASPWGAFWLSGCFRPVCNCLSLLLGIDSSGVAWVSWCAVWVPACIGCMCLVARLCDAWLVSLLPLSGGFLCTLNCFRYLTFNHVKNYQWRC